MACSRLRGPPKANGALFSNCTNNFYNLRVPRIAARFLLEKQARAPVRFWSPAALLDLDKDRVYYSPNWQAEICLQLLDIPTAFSPLNYLPKPSLTLGFFWARFLPCFWPPFSFPRVDPSRKALGIFITWSLVPFDPIPREVQGLPFPSSLLCPRNNFFLGWLSVGTSIPFRTKHYSYNLF